MITGMKLLRSTKIKIAFLLLLGLQTVGLGQRTPINVYKYKNYYGLAYGFFFHYPTQSNTTGNLHRAFSRDQVLTFSWHHFFEKRFGTLVKSDLANESVRYKYTDNTGAERTRENSIYYKGKKGHYAFTLAMTYHFNVARKIDVLLSLGPQVHLNRYLPGIDSVVFVHRNVRHIGIGFNFGVCAAYRIKDGFNVFINASIQRGFLTLREFMANDKAGNSARLSYSGNGPGLTIGLSFSPKLLARETDGTSEP